MAKITKIEPVAPLIIKRKKVAAYARVSMDSERLQHSLSAQVSYYSELIQKNPEWQYAGVYADEGISGTGTTKRHGFREMIADAEAGKIDIILTKSISRFARNTVDLLETVRHLKNIGVEIRFEKENIHSLDGDGEVMLSILASFAQEESRSISENVKWGIRKRMEEGNPNGRPRILGYRWEGDTLIIVPEEAAVVRRIYQNFLDGKSRLETEREFEAEGIRSIYGNVMRDSQIKQILTNITYTGNMLLQKEFVTDPINKKRRKNRGELPQYFMPDTHEPIIDKKTFDYVQEEMERRRKLGALANKSLNTSYFTAKIKCPYCNCSYMHDQRHDRGYNLEYWVCGSKKKRGGKCCVKGSLQDIALKRALADVLGTDGFDESVFTEQVDHIEVPAHMEIDVFLKDGRVEHRKCVSTARKDFWTKVYKDKVSRYRKTHRSNIAGASCFTLKIKCKRCGCNYRGQIAKVTYTESGKIRFWRCADHKDGNCPSLREDLLKEDAAAVLGLENFDPDIFDEKVEKIEVDGNQITYVLKDDKPITHEWHYTRQGVPQSEHQKEVMRVYCRKKMWTPERRKQASERMKKMRKERGANWLKQ